MKCPFIHPHGFSCSLSAGHTENHKPVLKHECHATGCVIEVPPRMLMCLRHWRMVPSIIQRQIWATYQSGQEIRKDPTAEYLDAQHAAVRAVEQKEGR